MKIRSLVLLAVLCTFVAGVAIAAAIDKGPETMKIDVNKSGKSVPNFPHRKHQELPDLKGKCAECHHKDKAGDKQRSCGTCHTKPTEVDPTTKAIGFKDAFHKKCLGCHQNVKDKPEIAKCKTCHGA